jgi:hypothetical protein
MIKNSIFKTICFAISVLYFGSCGGIMAIRNKQNIFDMVSVFTKSRPFNPEMLEAQIHKPMEEMTTESNEYFTVFTSKNENKHHNGGISAELRLPTSKSTCKDGIIVLDFESEDCITQEDVIKEYGLGNPIPPDPDTPEEHAMFYLSYIY